jgi:hypothetical protein
MRAARLLVTATFAALACFIAPAGAQATETLHVGADFNHGKMLPYAAGTLKKARAAARVAAGRELLRAVGDRQLWPAVDSVYGVVYLKNFTLRAMGEHVEVWVASDTDEISSGLEFPAGDCRNGSVAITDEQAQLLASAFDGVIRPRESEAFSVAPDRAGAQHSVPARFGLPTTYFAGEGDNTVVLVDNVRDENFYDVNDMSDLPYVAGFFFSGFNELVDRNIVTLDAFDWLHRTGATPPNEPVPGDSCRSRPAIPHFYEAVLAHEYQHLLEHYEDPDESVWLNEGLSMYAEALTGYTDPSIPVTQVGFESLLQCFLGSFVVGGPENSLTLWGDQGGAEITCDYGAAESFLHLLADRYGVGFMSQLHRDDDVGLASVRKLVRAADSAQAAQEIVHDWAATVALDSLVDHDWSLSGGPAARFRANALDAAINWETEDAYATPGAPPNGSDYVRLRGRQGYLDLAHIDSIAFDGAESLAASPVEWSVDNLAPGRSHDSALYSGSKPNLDRSLVRSVRVPARNATLTFDTIYDMEPGFDFGFVQVSTDGGKTYRSLAGALTTDRVDPTAIPTVMANLPGLNGVSGGGDDSTWVTASFDLSAFEGKTVLLAFRYVTDPAIDGPGWLVDNVRIGGRLLSDGDSLAGWRSAEQVRPVAVHDFTVQLIGYTTGSPHRAFIYRLPLDRRHRGRISGAELRSIVGDGYDVVAAIVTYDEPTETLEQYAPYRLRVASSGGGGAARAMVVQPGG